MNSTQDLPLDDGTLDRLVDGELSREDYEAVLRSLDRAPGQWRRCALAFLEAQAWRRGLGELRCGADAPSLVTVASRRASASNRWSVLLAVAVSFLVAFGLGLWTRPFSPATPGGGAQMAKELVSGGVPPGEGSPSSAVMPARKPSGPSPSGNVMVVLDGADGSDSREVPVPVYDWSPHSVGVLSQTPTSIPSEVRRAVRAMGYELRLHKQFIQGQTADGRPALIPVEQVEIAPAGRRDYQ